MNDLAIRNLAATETSIFLVEVLDFSQSLISTFTNENQDEDSRHNGNTGQHVESSIHAEVIVASKVQLCSDELRDPPDHRQNRCSNSFD